MERYKIPKRFNNSTVSKSVAIKWIEVNDLSSDQYSVNKTLMLRSDLCDYSAAYIVVKWRVNVTSTSGNKRRNKKLSFKNNAPFRSWISKINDTFIDNVEDRHCYVNL